MHRLLIDPFADDIALALAQDSAVLTVETAQGDDKSLLLSELYSRLNPKNLSEIILVNGPGNFTSLRVALGFARGLALGLNIPSRGIGVFDVDASLYAQIAPEENNAQLIRDARGGQYYLGEVKNDALLSLTLTDTIPPEAVSFERLDDRFTHQATLSATLELRLAALAQCAQNGIGKSPASALYIRAPQAALPSEPPLVILD